MSSPAFLAMALVLSISAHTFLIAAIGSVRPDAMTAGPGKSWPILTAGLREVEEPVNFPKAVSADVLDAPHVQNFRKRQRGTQATGIPDDVSESPLGPVYYFSGNELDLRPVPATPVELDSVVGLTSDEGAAILRFWISAEGTVDLLSFEESSFPDEVTERLRNHAELLTFVPGQIRGISVPSTIRVEVKLDDDQPPH